MLRKEGEYTSLSLVKHGRKRVTLFAKIQHQTNTEINQHSLVKYGTRGLHEAVVTLLVSSGTKRIIRTLRSLVKYNVKGRKRCPVSSGKIW